MAFESSTSGHESRRTAEVERILPRIIDEIRSAAEQNSFFSEQTKQLILQSMSATPEEVMNELLDHSRRYRGLQSTEKELRHLLNDRILREVGEVISTRNSGPEQQALVLFLRYDVLNLRPQQ